MTAYIQAIQYKEYEECAIILGECIDYCNLIKVVIKKIKFLSLQGLGGEVSLWMWMSYCCEW